MNAKGVVSLMLSLLLIALGIYLVLPFTPLVGVPLNELVSVTSRFISVSNIPVLFSTVGNLVWSARGIDVLTMGFVFFVAVAGAVGLLKTQIMERR